jgi:hypothetical protein
LLARHLTPADVHDILMRQYRVLPSGDIKIHSTDWIVQTNASPLKIEDFDNIPIKREGNAFVYLRDVATVRLMGRVQQNVVLVKGKQIVIIVAMKSTEAFLDPGRGRWDQEDDLARRASLPEGREDQIAGRCLDLRKGFDLGCRA